MTHSSRHNRISLAILGVAVVGARLWAALAVWVVPGLIESGWRAESFGFVNAIFAGRAEHPLDEYLASWRRLWPGLAADLLLLGALAVLVVRLETRAVAERAFGSTAREAFRATPKLMLGVILLSLVVKEWYPLSQFPMFSAFQSTGGYVWVSDAADQPVATTPRLGVSADEVGKIFQQDLEAERELRGVTEPDWYLGSAAPKNQVVEAAALRTLRYLRDQRSDTREALKLWRTRVVLSEGLIRREREVLAEVPAG